MSTVSIKVKLRPFTVPNYVIHEISPGLRQDGFLESPKTALKDLDEQTLAALCEEFIDNVFLKAAKKRPKP